VSHRRSVIYIHSILHGVKKIHVNKVCRIQSGPIVPLVFICLEAALLVFKISTRRFCSGNPKTLIRLFQGNIRRASVLDMSEEQSAHSKPHQNTIEGFRSIATIVCRFSFFPQSFAFSLYKTLRKQAIFLGALQATALSFTFDVNHTTANKLVNAFWVSGLFLDVYGTVMASLTARWFEVLPYEDVDYINTTWVTKLKSKSAMNPSSLEDEEEETIPSSTQSAITRFSAWCTATALFSGFSVIGAGVTMFVLGLMIYIWTQQPLVVGIIGSVPVAVLTPLVGAYFLPVGHEWRRGIIKRLGKKRGSW
jgi:hypothetical protein